MPDVLELFGDYARAYAAGERPQARDYLARAGPKADELADLIDRFLRATPAPEASEPEVAAVHAWIGGNPPLVELRAQQGVRVDQVVDAIVGDLDLEETKRSKVKRYYQRLEQGLLEPGRVSEKVWGVVDGLLGTRAEELATLRPRPLSAQAAFLRGGEPAAAPAEPAAAPAVPAAAAEPAEQDEVDALFLFGR